MILSNVLTFLSIGLFFYFTYVFNFSHIQPNLFTSGIFISDSQTSCDMLAKTHQKFIFDDGSPRMHADQSNNNTMRLSQSPTS